MRFDFEFFFLWFISLLPRLFLPIPRAITVSVRFSFNTCVLYCMTFLITHSFEITYCFFSVHIGTAVLYFVDAYNSSFFFVVCQSHIDRIWKERTIKRKKTWWIMMKTDFAYLYSHQRNKKQIECQTILRALLLKQHEANRNFSRKKWNVRDLCNKTDCTPTAYAVHNPIASFACIYLT